VPLGVGSAYHAAKCDAIQAMQSDLFQLCGELCHIFFRGDGRFMDAGMPWGIAKRTPDL